MGHSTGCCSMDLAHRYNRPLHVALTPTVADTNTTGRTHGGHHFCTDVLHVSLAGSLMSLVDFHCLKTSPASLHGSLRTKDWTRSSFRDLERGQATSRPTWPPSCRTVQVQNGRLGNLRCPNTAARRLLFFLCVDMASALLGDAASLGTQAFANCSALDESSVCLMRTCWCPVDA